MKLNIIIIILRTFQTAGLNIFNKGEHCATKDSRSSSWPFFLFFKERLYWLKWVKLYHVRCSIQQSSVNRPGKHFHRVVLSCLSLISLLHAVNYTLIFMFCRLNPQFIAKNICLLRCLMKFWNTFNYHNQNSDGHYAIDEHRCGT